MLKRHNNTISCPDCGRSWCFMGLDGLNAGDACPSDDCPSNESTPLGALYAVSEDFDGDGIFSIGALGALRAMMPHWVLHLEEGHDPKIISDDIEGVVRQLETMRDEILRRTMSTTPATFAASIDVEAARNAVSLD